MKIENWRIERSSNLKFNYRRNPISFTAWNIWIPETLVISKKRTTKRHRLKEFLRNLCFIDDNIWTMDGDGSPTAAIFPYGINGTGNQHHSKLARQCTSSIKQKQKISRDNEFSMEASYFRFMTVLEYLCSRINEEQANGQNDIWFVSGLYGSMKSQISSDRRKTTSGLICIKLNKRVSNIIRRLKCLAPYTGTKNLHQVKQ